MVRHFVRALFFFSSCGEEEMMGVSVSLCAPPFINQSSGISQLALHTHRALSLVPAAELDVNGLLQRCVSLYDGWSWPRTQCLNRTNSFLFSCAYMLTSFENLALQPDCPRAGCMSKTRQFTTTQSPKWCRAKLTTTVKTK